MLPSQNANNDIPNANNDIPNANVAVIGVSPDGFSLNSGDFAVSVGNGCAVAFIPDGQEAVRFVVVAENFGVFDVQKTAR